MSGNILIDLDDAIQSRDDMKNDTTNHLLGEDDKKYLALNLSGKEI